MTDQFHNAPPLGANGPPRPDPPMRLYLARTASWPETCDRCCSTIAPHTLVLMATTGCLYCQECGRDLKHPTEG